MKKNDRKPEIRFSGFETAWQKKCFGDEFDILSNNTLSRDCLNYNQGIAKNVHYGDVLIKFNEYLDASKEVLPYIEDERVIDKFQNSFLRDGDIVIADTAEDETVGKCTEIGNIRDLPIIAGLHTMPCRPKSKYAPMYLGYYLNSNAYHRELLPLMQGVKVTSISRSGVKDTDIIVSEEYDEQKKIGQYLFALDEKIKFEKNKLDRLIILKKTMLVKMFPQGNSKVPEIRFGNYTDEWEQRKFGDLGSVSMCKRIFKEQTSAEGEIPFYKIGTFGSTPDAFITRELFEEYKEKFSYPEIGDMLISASGTIGRTVEYTGEDEYFQDSNIVWFMHDERIENSFLKVVYSFVKWSGIEGSTIKRLYNDNFLKTEFMLPSIKEQQQIGDYFSNLDHLITLHQRKVDKLKNIKSSCMDKMFV